MNAAISPADSIGRMPLPVDESMNPPVADDVCAQTMFCDAQKMTSAAHRSVRIRRVPKSICPPRTSGPMPLPVDESMNPPVADDVCAQTMFCDAQKMTSATGGFIDSSTGN